jgi:hypothetical protein
MELVHRIMCFLGFHELVNLGDHKVCLNCEFCEERREVEDDPRFN